MVSQFFQDRAPSGAVLRFGLRFADLAVTRVTHTMVLDFILIWDSDITAMGMGTTRTMTRVRVCLIRISMHLNMNR